MGNPPLEVAPGQHKAHDHAINYAAINFVVIPVHPQGLAVRIEPTLRLLHLNFCLGGLLG